jgi:hypothetical protein
VCNFAEFRTKYNTEFREKYRYCSNVQDMGIAMATGMGMDMGMEMGIDIDVDMDTNMVMNIDM